MDKPTFFYGPAVAGCVRPLLKMAARLKRMATHSLLVFCVLMLAACSHVVDLQTGLNDTDANEIVMLLHRFGIDADKQQMKDGITIKVDEAEIARATEAMQNAGLPRRRLADLGTMFKKDGMISTPMEERIRYIHGLSQELEGTLQDIDNVVEARVHVVLPERIAPGEPITPSSAAVFIKHHTPFDEDAMLPRIRKLVGASIPGLSGRDASQKVSVIFTTEPNIAPELEWTLVGPFKVEVKSAGALRVTFAVVIAVVLMYLLRSFGGYLMRFPRIRNLVRLAINRVRVLLYKLVNLLTPGKHTEKA